MLVERDAPLREAIDTLKATYVELLGVSQAEAKDFQKLIRDAIAQMENSIDGRKVRQLNTLKKTWREEAQALMDDSPVYKAWEKIRKGGGLDTGLRGEGCRIWERDRLLPPQTGP